jgi:hypothetical protein
MRRGKQIKVERDRASWRGRERQREIGGEMREEKIKMKSDKASLRGRERKVGGEMKEKKWREI